AGRGRRGTCGRNRATRRRRGACPRPRRHRTGAAVPSVPPHTPFLTIQSTTTSARYSSSSSLFSSGIDPGARGALALAGQPGSSSRSRSAMMAIRPALPETPRALTGARRRQAGCPRARSPGRRRHRSTGPRGSSQPHHDHDVPHVEGLVPGMAVRRWTAAFGAALEEHLVALGSLPRGEHGHVLADDVEGRRVVLRGDDERLCGHLGGSSGKAIARVRRAGANPRPTRGARGCDLRCCRSGSPCGPSAPLRWPYLAVAKVAQLGRPGEFVALLHRLPLCAAVVASRRWRDVTHTTILVSFSMLAHVRLGTSAA